MKARALLNASTASLALASALLVAACNRSPSSPAPRAQAADDAPDPGYRAPPQLRGWETAADGSVSLKGRAWPSSKVRMVSPAGVEQDTTADGSGAWTLPLGPVTEPSLYRLAEESGTRHADAEGLIVVLPGQPIVALLRAGYGAQVQDRGRAGALKIQAVDYDSGGGTVVSGRAAASVAVRLMVDGLPAGDGAAGPDGRFSVVLAKPLAMGAHEVEVQTPKAKVSTAVQITPPEPPTDTPYRAQAQSFGWRIDWVTASEGAQTTLILGS
jgi:hypothetical protein